MAMTMTIVEPQEPLNDAKRRESNDGRGGDDVVLKKRKIEKDDRVQEREAEREAKKEAKRIQKELEEMKKREAKRAKKEEEEERRRLKKEREEEERRLKKEKIEIEKEAKRLLKEQEKAAKIKKREEELKAREERKRAEDEEKQKRREEVERKKRDKILEKQRLEEEKERKKLEEEAKKQKRSITNFFKPKTSAGTDDANVTITSEGNVSIDLTTITPKANRSILDDHQSTILSSPISECKSSAPVNDFESYFLPFHVKPNMTIANNQVPESNKWDAFLKGEYKEELEEEQPLIEPLAKPEGIVRAIDVLKCLNAGSIEEANKLFPRVPLKYIKFYENRRGAYYGTFSYTEKDVIEPVNIKLNPCTKVTLRRVVEDPESRPVIDYDYDSDVEDGGEDEDEEGEGEDLNSGDEDEEDDEDDYGNNDMSDIDEFVEKDGQPVNEGKRKGVVGPLVAIVRHCLDTGSSGDGGDDFGCYFKSLQWERLDHTMDFPIDPFGKAELATSTSTSAPPLAQASESTSAGDVAAITTVNVSKPADATLLVAKRKTITDPSALAALREFVSSQGSLTIGTLAELAAKGGVPALGGASASLVRNTLRTHAKFDRKAGKWVWQGAGP